MRGIHQCQGFQCHHQIAYQNILNSLIPSLSQYTQNPKQELERIPNNLKQDIQQTKKRIDELLQNERCLELISQLVQKEKHSTASDILKRSEGLSDKHVLQRVSQIKEQNSKYQEFIHSLTHTQMKKMEKGVPPIFDQIVRESIQIIKKNKNYSIMSVESGRQLKKYGFLTSVLESDTNKIRGPEERVYLFLRQMQKNFQTIVNQLKNTEGLIFTLLQRVYKWGGKTYQTSTKNQNNSNNIPFIGQSIKRLTEKLLATSPKLGKTVEGEIDFFAQQDRKSKQELFSYFLDACVQKKLIQSRYAEKDILKKHLDEIIEQTQLHQEQSWKAVQRKLELSKLQDEIRQKDLRLAQFEDQRRVWGMQQYKQKIFQTPVNVSRTINSINQLVHYQNAQRGSLNDYQAKPFSRPAQNGMVNLVAKQISQQNYEIKLQILKIHQRLHEEKYKLVRIKEPQLPKWSTQQICEFLNSMAGSLRNQAQKIDRCKQDLVSSEQESNRVKDKLFSFEERVKSLQSELEDTKESMESMTRQFKMQTKQSSDKMAQLQSQNFQYKCKYDDAVRKFYLSQANEQLLQIQLRQKEALIKEKTTSYQLKIRKRYQQIQEKHKLLDQKQKQLQRYKMKLINQQTQKELFQNKINQIESQNNSLKQQKSRLQDQTSKLEEELSRFKVKETEYEQIINKFQQSQTERGKELIRYRLENEQMKKEAKIVEANAQKQRAVFEAQSSSQNLQNEELQKELNNKAEQLSRLLEYKKQSELQIHSLKASLSDYTQVAQKKEGELKAIKQNYELSIKQLNDKLIKSTFQNSQVKEELKKINLFIEKRLQAKISLFKQSAILNKKFNSLEPQQDSSTPKQLIINQLKQHQKREITGSKLFFKSGGSIIPNMEQILQRPNLLTIFQTENGKIIAAFGSQPSKVKNVQDSGFIMTMKEDIIQVFDLCPGRKSSQHSGCYLIYGKSDLRITIQNNANLILESNFGCKGCAFNNRGFKSDYLLGAPASSKSSVKLISYEIYEIEFSGQQDKIISSQEGKQIDKYVFKQISELDYKKIENRLKQKDQQLQILRRGIEQNGLILKQNQLIKKNNLHIVHNPQINYKTIWQKKEYLQQQKELKQKVGNKSILEENILLKSRIQEIQKIQKQFQIQKLNFSRKFNELQSQINRITQQKEEIQQMLRTKEIQNDTLTMQLSEVRRESSQKTIIQQSERQKGQIQDINQLKKVEEIQSEWSQKYNILKEQMNAMRKELTNQQNKLSTLDLQSKNEKLRFKSQTNAIQLKWKQQIQQNQKKQKLLEEYIKKQIQWKQLEKKVTKPNDKTNTNTIKQQSNNKKQKQLISQNESLQQQISFLKRQLDKYLSISKQHSQNPFGNPFLRYQYEALFPGDLLDGKEIEKGNLVRHIETFMKKPILKTKIIYAYDPQNKTNFHVYIDGKPNLVLIVKTPKTIIAGYYSGPIQQKVPLDKPGILIQVSKNQSYKLLEKKDIKPRPVVFDKYYIIYGNAELRIKTGEKKIFSNFGISNAYFDSKKRKVGEFFCQGDVRQTDFETYEFHQIIFDESKEQVELKRQEQEQLTRENEELKREVEQK